MVSLRSFVALVAILWIGGGRVFGQATDPAASPTEIRLLFKLDPRLNGPTYGGERWLSPPTFTSGAQEGSTAAVDVKVQGVDARGRVVAVTPEWTPADPEMVSVTGEGDRFRIIAKRAGESKLRVAAQGVSMDLVVKAKNLGKAMQVEIHQGLPEEKRRVSTTVDPKATGASPATDPDQAATALDAPVLGDETARNSYAVGWEMGGRLSRQIRELDPDLVTRGLRDGLAGENPLLTETELKTALAAIQAEVRIGHVEARKQLAERNKATGEAFLSANRTKEGVVTLESGLQYKILVAGEGRRPTLDDTVICHYRATSIDGKEFDSSRKRNKPATLALKRVVKGWSEALQRMPVGSTWQVFIPPNLAYGARGSREGIGPNETLVFEVELISIKDAAGAQARAGQLPDRVGPAELGKKQ